jgi:hypothetical protein
MTDIDILTKVPDEMLAAAASRFPDAAAATENFQRVIVRLPDGHRAEVTFARISEKEGRSALWSWMPAGAVLIE